MALQWQLVNIPVDGGLNDKASPLLVDAPASTLMFDAVFDKNGEIVKRNGWTALADPGSGTPHTIGANRYLLAAKTSDGTYRYEQSQAAWSRLSGAITMLQTPHSVGSVRYGDAISTSMADANADRSFVQTVEQNGYLISFIKPHINNEIEIRVIEIETHDVVFSSTLQTLFSVIGADTVMKAVKHYTRYVSLLLSDSGTLVLYQYDTTTHTMTESVTPLASPADELFDVCHGSSASVLPAVAYRNGSSGITVRTLQTDGEFSSSSVSFNSASYDRVAINTYNTAMSLWLAW